ncbi:GntR family transcriptional regulator [Polaromonas sp.]|uniref:GntR family transcriptional regulator n=1 Tax=Polaromonas sp. TaxID=1869339 RepID=UPI003BA8E39F
MPQPDPTPSFGDDDAELHLRSRRSVGDDIYEVLLARLISLKIPPGARISIDKLARELGTSQTPIRAALIRLEAEGLIVKTHLVGYSAAAIPSSQRFGEIFQLRLLLEPHAAAQAATKLTADEREDLRGLINNMFEPSKDDEKLAYGKFAHWDARFHRLIALSGGGQLMAETLDRLQTHMHLFRVLFHSSVTQEAIKEHEELLDALITGHADRARTAMKRHIQLSFKRISPVLDTYVDAGSLRREIAARRAE